ncbi:MAG: hypothetical protein Ct9H300mP8_06040 [Gammaproteobacteria bacterium]|nr:MAG: hypothetical protein Ct9H300mP8_06040 [Gammaproteobacteria bacterium]
MARPPSQNAYAPEVWSRRAVSRTSPRVLGSLLCYLIFEDRVLRFDTRECCLVYFVKGQGVLVVGELDKRRVFYAKEVLAKHDENYMPPELVDMGGES